MIYILFYLLGYIMCYFFLKTSIVSHSKQSLYIWTKEDRIITLILSAGSYLSIIVAIGLVLTIEHTKDLSKPVKW